jgi:hypothetical protein
MSFWALSILSSSNSYTLMMLLPVQNIHEADLDKIHHRQPSLPVRKLKRSDSDDAAQRLRRTTRAVCVPDSETSDPTHQGTG